MMMIHTQAMSVSLRLHYAQKVPFNGSLGWAWRGEASANFWSRQDHSPEISAIWEANFGRWMCRWYVSNQFGATLIVSQQIVAIEAFHQRQHRFLRPLRLTTWFESQLVLELIQSTGDTLG